MCAREELAFVILGAFVMACGRGCRAHVRWLAWHALHANDRHHGLAALNALGVPEPALNDEAGGVRGGQLPVGHEARKACDVGACRAIPGAGRHSKLELCKAQAQGMGTGVRG